MIALMVFRSYCTFALLQDLQCSLSLILIHLGVKSMQAIKALQTGRRIRHLGLTPTHEGLFTS